jgi:uncharacterized protein YjbJ (UPF0337 family)
MDKDRVEGKVKDVAGRVERQVGEWTGNKDAQVHGAAKQVEGKVQNTFGKAKDAVRDAAKDNDADTNAELEDERIRSEKKAS